jgi:hypothetical protein
MDACIIYAHIYIYIYIYIYTHTYTCGLQLDDKGCKVDSVVAVSELVPSPKSTELLKDIDWRVCKSSLYVSMPPLFFTVSLSDSDSKLYTANPSESESESELDYLLPVYHTQTQTQTMYCRSMIPDTEWKRRTEQGPFVELLWVVVKKHACIRQRITNC